MKKIYLFAVSILCLVVFCGCVMINVNNTDDEYRNEIINYAWTCDDGSIIYFYESGGFRWFKDAEDESDNYYSGKYELYLSEDAYEYITEDLEEYGVTDDELDALFERNEKYKEDNLVCLVLINEELKTGNEYTLFEVGEIRNYFGFYYNNMLDLANMDTANYVAFTKTKAID